MWDRGCGMVMRDGGYEVEDRDAGRRMVMAMGDLGGGLGMWHAGCGMRDIGCSMLGCGMWDGGLLFGVMRRMQDVGCEVGMEYAGWRNSECGVRDAE